MSDKGLGFYDAVLAINQEALNRHFQELFAPGAFEQQIKITIDDDLGKSVTGTMGVPTLTFLPEQQRLVKMTVPFGPGSTFHGGKVWNEKKQELDAIETDLTGKSLGFVVALERMSNTDVRDADFTVQALYMQLTELKNIDTDNFGVQLDELGGAEQLFNALTDYIKRATKQAKVGSVPESLFVTRVQVPTTPNTEGPMRPHEAAFSATALARAPMRGELNCLLMMKDRALPADARAGLFNDYWGSPGQPKAPDVTLVLSDFPLLENFAQPAIIKAWPNLKLNLNRGGIDVRSQLVQAADLIIDKKTTLTGLVAQINDSGQIQIDMSVLSNDRLQVSQAGGEKPDIDFSLVSVQLTKPIRYYVTLNQDDAGNVSCTMVEDDNLKKAEPTRVVRWNGAVKKREDIVKWVTGLAPLLIPGVGELALIVMVACQTIATTIEVEVNDRDFLNSFGSKLTDGAASLATCLELPGSPVMTFGKLRMKGAVALIDGTFVAIPSVTPSQIQPYAMSPYPREKAGEPQNVVQTDAQIVGETLLSFKYVNDPDYPGTRRSNVPYYLLRREQYWKRIKYERYSGKTTAKSELTFEVVQEATTTQTIEKATEIKVGAKGELKFLEIFSPELSAEISHTLKTTTVTQLKTTESGKVTHTVERPASEKGYTIASWIAVDHYIVRRPEDGKIIAEAEIYNVDYLQEDRIDDPNETASS